MASFRKLPSGKWQATVKHPSGKRYTKTDPLRKVVATWSTELEQQIRRGEFIDPRAGRMTLDAWWVRWLETRTVQKATAAKIESQWRVHVQPAFGSWPLSSIQSWDVESWVARLVRDQVGAETVASSLRLLGQLLGAATRHRLIHTNPVEVVKAPSVPKHVDRFLSVDEANRLVAAISKVDDTARVPRGEKMPRVVDPEQQLFVRLMLEAGLRWEETAGLHVFRVDLMRKLVRVQEVLERDGSIKPIPKSKAGQRVVPLIDDLVMLLSAHLTGKPRDGLVFERAGRPLSYSNWLKRVWKPAVAAAALETPLPTPHDCRHSYGSWLANQGVPVHEIAALMGHGSLRAVERYVHASEARMERARTALGARGAHAPSQTAGSPASRGMGDGA